MSIERELQKNYQDVFYPPMPEPDVQVAAGPTKMDFTGMAVPDTESPAFTMPGMGKRTQKSEVGQNLPIVAADLAAGAGKGLISGIAGFAGDIEALYQGVKGLINRGGDEGALNAFLNGMAEQTILPTSDEVSKWLDQNVGPVVPAGADMSPEMMKAREAGATAGEFAGQMVADPAIAVKAAKSFANVGKYLTKTGAKLNDAVEISSAGDIAKPAFKKWFSESKVANDDGTPMVVYHGTSKDFESFSTEGRQHKTHGTGAFFSSSPDVAATYMTGKNERTIPVYLSLKNPLVIDAKGSFWSDLPKDATFASSDGLSTMKLSDLGINVKNFDQRISTDDLSRWARSNGYDGAVFNNVVDFGASGKYISESGQSPSSIYVAFDPKQVKSVFNKGTWNPEDPRILHGAGGLATGVGAGTMSTSQQEPK